MIYQKSKAKEIITDNTDIKRIVSDTVDKMAEAVGSTLGPGGRKVIIERDGLSPLATKDGVTVAKSLGVANAEANLIVDSAKEICLNTAKDAGDGTTTAIVLANAIIKNGHTFLDSNPKYNPQRMVDELQDAYESVIVPFLKEVSITTDTEEQLVQVAKISANGDSEIASAAVDAIMAAGDDGHVLFHESQGGKTYVEPADGYIVTTGLKDLGQIGPAFINDSAGQQVKMDNGYAILYDGSLNDLKVPGLIQDAVSDEGGYHDATPILVFAHGFSDAVLGAFAKTTKSGHLVIPVKTPRNGLPNGASLFLQDMAAYTGGTVYDPATVEDMDDEGFGGFESARINMYESFIIGSPDQGAVDARVVELKAIEQAAFSGMDKSHIRAAIARLTGGVTTIHVGGFSELEIREKVGRVEDAVEAVRSAIAEGIVSGGCSMHLKLAAQLAAHKDRRPSWDILVESLQAPFKLLLSNCGENHEEVYPHLSEIFNSLDVALPDKVFDANRHELVDPIADGIIEPAKVVRVSIANALSVASLLTTLGGIVVVPRNSDMEMQMELANQAFSNMMGAQDGAG
jgi:chaperonin GroEL